MQEPLVLWTNLVTEFLKRNISVGLLRLPWLVFWNYIAQKNFKKPSAITGVKRFLQVHKTQKWAALWLQHRWTFMKDELSCYRTPLLSAEQKGKQQTTSMVFKKISLKFPKGHKREIHNLSLLCRPFFGTATTVLRSSRHCNETELREIYVGICGHILF